MSGENKFDIFLVTAPGLEATLGAEAREKGFRSVRVIAGGVTIAGGWDEVWRANLVLRGAARVIARIASFRALHLAQLDKRACKVPWHDVLRKDTAFRVEASCSKSRIYHSGAAAERVARAIREALGAPFSPDAAVTVKVRIEDDLCTLSVDTTGEALHKRGHKEAVNAAPMRENLAALFLQLCGYDGREPVLDPMCGSGTFVIEAAEIAAGLYPGRTRRFAFEELATFDATAWHDMRASGPRVAPPFRFYGSDKDAGAIRMSGENAARAGVTEFVQFDQVPVSSLTRPDGPPGLVIVNPPYGDRLGEKGSLSALYRALGTSLLKQLSGWRVGLITTDPALAKATGLPLGEPSAPVSHGGLRVRLYRTKSLP